MNNPTLSQDAAIRFQEWFKQFTDPYTEYEKNKEQLFKMLEVVGEKEAPMEVVSRLEEIKRLRRMEFLFGRFLAQEKEKSRQEGAEAVKEAIKQVCSDEEVHCDYFCNTCGGVGEFLAKLRAILTPPEATSKESL